MNRMKEYAKKEFKYTILPRLQEMPKLEADEVLIKVRAGAIHVLDMIGLDADSEKKDLDEVLISEYSGCIIKVGKSVAQWKIGDKVCAFVTTRGYAKEVVVSSRCVYRPWSMKTSCIPLEYAAGLPMATCITYYALKKCLDLRKGDLLVIHDAVPFYSFFALASAKYFGLRVLVVTDLDSLAEDYKKNGADAVINYRNVELVRSVRKMSKRKGGDAAAAVLSFGWFEGDILTDYLKCLAKNGVILQCCGEDECMNPQVKADPRIKERNIVSDLMSMDQVSLGSLIREVAQYPILVYFKLRRFPLSDAAAIDWKEEWKIGDKIIVVNDTYVPALREKIKAFVYGCCVW